MRHRRQGSNVAPSFGRGASIRQGEIPECPHCHRRHLDVWRLLIGGCFQCGSTNHLIAQCPRESRIIEVCNKGAEENQLHYLR